jgi:hypothetical protein
MLGQEYKNDTRTTRMTCQQPFHSQWRNHYHQKKQLMFARVRAYILQHLAVSASDLLSAIELETLVGNDTTTSRTPLAPIDANANGGRVLRHNCRTIKVVGKSGSNDELLESLLAYVLDNEKEAWSSRKETTIESTVEQPQQSRKHSHPYITGTQVVGKHTIENVPSNIRCILANRLSSLQREAEEGRRLKAALSNGKYCWGPKASHYLTWY